MGGGPASPGEPPPGILPARAESLTNILICALLIAAAVLAALRGAWGMGDAKLLALLLPLLACRAPAETPRIALWLLALSVGATCLGAARYLGRRPGTARADPRPRAAPRPPRRRWPGPPRAALHKTSGNGARARATIALGPVLLAAFWLVFLLPP